MQLFKVAPSKFVKRLHNLSEIHMKEFILVKINHHEVSQIYF